MSARNRPHPIPLLPTPPTALLPSREAPFSRPHPSLLDDPHQLPRRPPAPAAAAGPLLSHPSTPPILQDRLAAQHHEIQGLLADNQRLAATHVALKQELELAQGEIAGVAAALASARADADAQLRKGFDKAMQLEADLREVDARKAELMQVRADVKQLGAAREELAERVQGLTRDLERAGAELRQVPALKGDIEAMRQELQQARAAIECERKGYAENYEHGQAMEKNLIGMARELEKLRTELSNAEKRARAAAAVGNPGPAYNGSYGYPEGAHSGNPYPAGYGMNPTVEGVPQYGPGSAPISWGSYDMQRAHGLR